MEGSSAGGEGARYNYDFYNASSTLSGGDGGDDNCAVNSEEAEGESARRAALHERDPVNCLKLSAFAKAQLETAGGVHGGALGAALNGMDPAIAGQLKGMLEI